MATILLIVIYLSFISLGLPDPLLGAAWPTIYQDLAVPVSYAGIISVIISVGTVISSLTSDFFTRKLGAGLVTTISVGITALALLGFSLSGSFWMLCLLSVPYGLGAGCVDAALNNYVALHYSAKHMSWLHSMWGVGICIGPSLLSVAFSRGMTWNTGYRYIFYLQIGLTVLLILSLPLWKKRRTEAEEDAVKEGIKKETVSDKRTAKALKLPGVKAEMITFFCYCGVEQTVLLWGSTFLVLGRGYSEEQGAKFAILFCLGITAGRILSGFLASRFQDKQMVIVGQGIILLGIIFLFLPVKLLTLMGLVIIGLGCAPIYPSLIHSTPEYFGSDLSQVLIGFQMASAYMGTTILPPVIGKTVELAGVQILPMILLGFLVLMTVTHFILINRVKKVQTCD